MPPPSDLVLGRYRRILQRNRNITATRFARAWTSLDGRDERDIATFAALVAPTVAAATEATFAAATAFTALLLDIPTPAVNSSRLAVRPRLRDPFTAHWHALGEGRPYPEAVAAGTSAAEAAGANYVQSVARRAGDEAAAGRDVRWRREAEPGACQWCRVRDGNTYRTAAKADFGHSRCFCDVVPAT